MKVLNNRFQLLFLSLSYTFIPCLPQGTYVAVVLSHSCCTTTFAEQLQLSHPQHKNGRDDWSCLQGHKFEIKLIGASILHVLLPTIMSWRHVLMSAPRFKTGSSASDLITGGQAAVKHWVFPTNWKTFTNKKQAFSCMVQHQLPQFSRSRKHIVEHQYLSVTHIHNTEVQNSQAPLCHSFPMPHALFITKTPHHAASNHQIAGGTALHLSVRVENPCVHKWTRIT